ncbi:MULTISPECIES: hypothetical protein [Caulobacter]|uniref:Uncharacterized protein n=1 Tax=Caulobacter vibrioides OR37 TaxID=1292034 RepID=R0EHS4_CAUVI|nr:MULTISPECIES: hypothetical protein [Caulobacter]ENZ81579.1 hypothetical protein OR37_02517 [Caulobacter vibrioides OR37]PIB96981.1 hypothetical protein CSW60_21100 [Caulobacter sp. X]
MRNLDAAIRAVQPGDWATWLTFFVAVVALVFSVLAWRTSAKAQRLAERQEARRTPKLEVRLLESFHRDLGEEGKLFAFKVQIANPTDTGNSVSLLELAIRYRRDLPMSLRLPAIAYRDFGEGHGLSTPFRIDAHQVESGWCYFLAAPKLLAGSVTDGYEVIASDTHQQATGVEVLVMSERRA